MSVSLDRERVQVMRRVADDLEAEGCPREIDMTRSPEVVRLLREAAREMGTALAAGRPAPLSAVESVGLAFRLLDTVGGGAYSWRVS